MPKRTSVFGWVPGGGGDQARSQIIYIWGGGEAGVQITQTTRQISMNIFSWQNNSLKKLIPHIGRSPLEVLLKIDASGISKGFSSSVNLKNEDLQLNQERNLYRYI